MVMIGLLVALVIIVLIGGFLLKLVKFAIIIALVIGGYAFVHGAIDRKRLK
jgi:hypothetical protein